MLIIDIFTSIHVVIFSQNENDTDEVTIFVYIFPKQS